MKKLGFTLTEMLVALFVIGILAAVTTPVIRKVVPDQNKVMIKRVYSLTTNIVKSLINDSQIYSPMNDVGERVYIGFDNFERVIVDGESYGGDNKYGKFTDLFLNSLSVNKPQTSENCTISFKESSLVTLNMNNNTCYKVTTKDGVLWTFIEPNENSEYTAFIMADVNGLKRPNCSEGSNACATRKDGFDQYIMGIRDDGKIKINMNDVWARSAINNATTLND